MEITHAPRLARPWLSWTWKLMMAIAVLAAAYVGLMR
jgi:hypothetical protein